MHLWPSMRLRDSFKFGYLKKLELNLHLMEESENQRRRKESPDDADDNQSDNSKVVGEGEGTCLVICRDLLMILSCCYCCFCCGACVTDEDDS